MSPTILTTQILAEGVSTKIEARKLSDEETRVVAAGTAVITTDDLRGGALPDGGGRGIRADRIYRK